MSIQLLGAYSPLPELKATTNHSTCHLDCQANAPGGCSLGWNPTSNSEAGGRGLEEDGTQGASGCCSPVDQDPNTNALQRTGPRSPQDGDSADKL